MKNNYNFVPQLSDLPIFNVVNSYKLSDFGMMTKQQLIEVLPSDACISWSKQRIVEEVSQAYTIAKDYFDQYSLELSKLSLGQLCLVVDPRESSIISSSSVVYVFLGMKWFPFPDNSNVSCKMQELSIRPVERHDGYPVDLHCNVSNYGHNKNQKIYPISNDQLVMGSEKVKNLKAAISIISSSNTN